MAVHPLFPQNPEPEMPINPLDRIRWPMTRAQRETHTAIATVLRNLPRNTLGIAILEAMGFTPPRKPQWTPPKLDAVTLARSNAAIAQMRAEEKQRRLGESYGMGPGKLLELASSTHADDPSKLDLLKTETRVAVLDVDAGVVVREAFTRGSDNKALAEAYKARRNGAAVRDIGKE